MIELPEDIIAWLRFVFRGCNARISEKLSKAPNLPEETFDLTWIEHLSQYSSPIKFESAWTAKIETHYLGGMRHFGGWEIADIGVLLFVRAAPAEAVRKVALLQSKRLYPLAVPIREETLSDFEIGFFRLADPEDDSLSISLGAEFRFTESSLYGAIKAASRQVRAIDKFQQQQKLAVHYQFYNPWRMPYTQRVPLVNGDKFSGQPEVGVRILRAADVHKVLDGKKSGASPTMAEIRDGASEEPTFGWSLENFIADEFLACREGTAFESVRESRMFDLFNRRSGPISAAIAITIEGPEWAQAS